MVKIIHAQTIMLQEELDQLKELSREYTTKNALYKAVEHYINCVGKTKKSQKTMGD